MTRFCVVFLCFRSKCCFVSLSSVVSTSAIDCLERLDELVSKMPRATVLNAAALLRPVHFLSPEQQSGIHCLIICAIQLLTPNNLGRT